MDTYKATFEAWNQLAGIYKDRFMDLDLYNHTYDCFSELLAGGQGHILDIGCGPGNITRYLLHKRPELHITGLDVAPAMLELAQHYNPKACFLQMDCRDLRTLKPGYTGIVCGFCIPYLSQEDIRVLLQDCERLLTDGGCLYISFVAGDYEASGYTTGSSGLSIFFYYHSPEYIRSELLQNGFLLVQQYEILYQRTEHISEVHTVWICQK